MSTTVMFISALLLLFTLGLGCLAYLIIRIRKIGNTVGSFECWIRRPGETSWTCGMARFGEDELLWFRLVGFSNKPLIKLSRREMLVSVPENLKTSTTVEVTITTEGNELECAMDTKWYNGLVSWVESEAPQPRHLF